MEYLLVLAENPVATEQTKAEIDFALASFAKWLDGTRLDPARSTEDRAHFDRGLRRITAHFANPASTSAGKASVIPSNLF